MARPIKPGLKYFPLDTDLFGNRKIQRLLQLYGCDGILVYLAMLCEIYASNGYYIAAGDDDLFFDLGFTLKLSEKRVKRIVACCVNVRLFDAKMLRTSRIYTSKGIQERFKEVFKRSPRAIDPAFMLIEEPVISVTETPVIVTETPVNVSKTPTKGKGNIKGNKKESKTNKTNETKENKRPATGSDEESLRRAELLRMAEAATKGC